MHTFKKIFHTLAAASLMAALLPCCTTDDSLSTADQRNVTVMLNVGSRAVAESDGTPTDVERKLHSLRVYAFVNGQLAGHYFTDAADLAVPAKFLMDLKMFSTTTQNVDFYLVANEGAMEGASVTLDANTSEDALKGFYFTRTKRETITTNGLPMYCNQQVALDVATESTEKPTGAHAGHTLLAQKVEFSLARPMAKLGVFAAKPAGETAELKITGLKLLQAGTRARNYVMPQAEATLQAVTARESDITLTPIAGAVTAALADGADRTDVKLYTPVLEDACYPFENPYANGGGWDKPGSGKETVLQVDYTFDGQPHTGLVYLPNIERNHYYTICCLMRNDGKVIVNYTVALWDDGGKTELEWGHPTFTFTPFKSDTYTEDYTIKYDPDHVGTPDADAAVFTFNMTAPAGQVWAASIDNAQDFTLWIDGQKASGNDAVALQMTADGIDHTLKVTASTPDGDGKKTKLTIKTLMWGQENAILNINSTASSVPGEEGYVLITRNDNQ